GWEDVDCLRDEAWCAQAYMALAVHRRTWLRPEAWTFVTQRVALWLNHDVRQALALLAPDDPWWARFRPYPRTLSEEALHWWTLAERCGDPGSALYLRQLTLPQPSKGMFFHMLEHALAIEPCPDTQPVVERLAMQFG